MNTKEIKRSVLLFGRKYGSGILTGIGLAGMVATAYFTGVATIKAVRIVDAKSKARGEKLTKKEVVEASWKCYVLPFTTGLCSAACIIGASSVNAKKNAALAAAYTIAETGAKEYSDKVIETIGEKKEKEIIDAIAQDKLDANPVKEEYVVDTRDGETLFFDPISGRYFKSNVEAVRKAINDVNQVLFNQYEASLNDLYYAVGLEETSIGEDLGWNARNGVIDVRFSAKVATNGKPCLVLGFNINPKYNFRDY